MVSIQNHLHTPWFRLFLLLTMAQFLFVTCHNSPEIPNHHALAIISHYVTLNEGTHTVIPYQVNLMALNLLQKEGSTIANSQQNIGHDTIINECQLYIQWVLNHTNPSDTHGLTDTIHNYEVDPAGKEHFLKDAEPIDRTAATFILLVQRFYHVTGYRQMISQARQKIQNIAYHIPHLQDEQDGLIRILPVGNRKLLENNCWDYAAMDAFIQLATEFGWGNVSFYQEVRDELKAAILEEFYRPNHHQFYWRKDGSDQNAQQFASDWNTFYPDSYAQLFPLLFNLIPPDDLEIGTQIWAKFCSLYRDKLNKQGKTYTDVLQRIVFQWAVRVMEQRDINQTGG